VLIAALIVLIVLNLALAGGYLWVATSSRRSPWRRLEARHVVANLKSGQAVIGVAVERRRGVLVLRNAELIAEAGKSTPVDGEVFVDATELDFIQVL
jgi:hypothetical protein